MDVAYQEFFSEHFKHQTEAREKEEKPNHGTTLGERATVRRRTIDSRR
jgi:hypothetical protein